MRLPDGKLEDVDRGASGVEESSGDDIEVAKDTREVDTFRVSLNGDGRTKAAAAGGSEDSVADTEGGGDMTIGAGGC